jgi:hypothetical protein
LIVEAVPAQRQRIYGQHQTNRGDRNSANRIDYGKYAVNDLVTPGAQKTAAPLQVRPGAISGASSPPGGEVTSWSNPAPGL